MTGAFQQRVQVCTPQEGGVRMPHLQDGGAEQQREDLPSNPSPATNRAAPTSTRPSGKSGALGASTRELCGGGSNTCSACICLTSASLSLVCPSFRGPPQGALGPDHQGNTLMGLLSPAPRELLQEDAGMDAI